MSDFTNNQPAFTPFTSPIKKPRSRVCVVTDSTTDILPSYAHALGLLVVPNRVRFGDQLYYDGVNLTPSQFFSLMAHAPMLPTTEPVTQHDLAYAYQLAFSRGATDVVSLHISGKLSQTVHNAYAVRQGMAPAPIEVIDTGLAGVGMWPAVTEAAKLASTGATPSEVVELARSYLARTRVYVMVEGLEHLRRSGRIGRARSIIGNLLDARPILTLQNGEVAPVETARPRQRAITRLRELALGQGEVETIVVSGSSLALMTEVEEVMQAGYTGTLHKTWLGPTIGANTGPAIGIAVVTRA